MPRSPMIRNRPLLLPSRRSRWGVEEARAVLERMRSSGLAVAEFAAKEGLVPQRLYWWQARLNAPTAKAAGFVEVTAVATPSPLELVLRTGDVIRVPTSFNEDALRRVLAVLDERANRRC